MCEKCNNGLGGDIFIIPEEIVGILTKRIEEYKTRYNGMPSRETIVQMILSAKAEIAPQKDECPVSNDNLRLAFITQNKADNKTDICKNETEISFEQCVETASGKIKEVIAALESEYGDVIVSHAIDVAIGPDDISDDVDHIIDRIGELEIKLDSVSEQIKEINFIEGSVCELPEPVYHQNPSVLDMLNKLRAFRTEIKILLNSKDLTNITRTKLEKICGSLKKTINGVQVKSFDATVGCTTKVPDDVIKSDMLNLIQTYSELCKYYRVQEKLLKVK